MDVSFTLTGGPVMRKIPYHRHALALSLIFQAEFQRPAKTQPYDDLVFDVLKRAVELDRWSDEKKADFYSRLQTSWLGERPTTFMYIQATVTKCLIQTEDIYGH